MIFLSKNGEDEYVNMLAHGAKVKPTSTAEFDFDASNDPIVLRGILNKTIVKCLRTGRNFFYVDSGYFGNAVGPLNPHGWKLWHRIVPDNLQHHAIQKRPADRWQRMGIELAPRRHGAKIVVAAPDEKPCKFYGIDQQSWVDGVVAAIKRFTDRPVEIRQRAARRQDRVHLDPLSTVLANDVHALVTYNSVAATEAVMSGVPAFVLAPANAAMPVANTDLTTLESPFFPDDDLRHAWVCHLAYGQFHVSEMKSGAAMKILLDQYE